MSGFAVDQMDARTASGRRRAAAGERGAPFPQMDAVPDGRLSVNTLTSRRAIP